MEGEGSRRIRQIGFTFIGLTLLLFSFLTFFAYTGASAASEALPGEPPPPVISYGTIVANGRALQGHGLFQVRLLNNRAGQWRCQLLVERRDCRG